MCTHINTLLNGKGAVVAVEEKTLPSQFHRLNFSNFNLFTELLLSNVPSPSNMYIEIMLKYIVKCIFALYFHLYYVHYFSCLLQKTNRNRME